MKKTGVIFLREYALYFISPIAYVFMVVFLAMTGWIYIQMLEGFSGSYVSSIEILFKVLVYFWMPLVTTIITMRLFAEEKRSGTIEALLTAPLADGQVVLGKYLAALCFMLTATAPALLFPMIVRHFNPGIPPVDMGGLIGGVLFFVLLAAYFTAIGLLMSLFTRNQIIAAVCCFAGVLVPLLAGNFVSFLPKSDQLVYYLSINEHLVDFVRGSIDTRPVIYYISATFFLLFAAVRVLESRNWR